MLKILLFLSIVLVLGISIGWTIFHFTKPKPSAYILPIATAAPIPTPSLIPEASQSASPSATTNHPLKKFIISATNYRFSPNQIKVKNGDHVEITLKVTTGLHNMFITGYNNEATMVFEGQTTKFDFIADQTGTFPFYCGVEDHQQRGMVGNLIVE